MNDFVDDKRKLDALLRNNFAAFAIKVFHTLNPGTTFLPNWHHEALAYHLELVRTGVLKRLVINLPPRTSKSIYVIALTAFIHGHDPRKKIASLSYASLLAGKLARDYRTVITSDWYRRLFPGTRISAEKNSEEEIVLTARGCRLGWSVTGSITGRGADLIIIDDPIKAEDALSETIRSSVNETFDGTVRSRLDDKTGGAILIVMQRFHPEDLSGHVLAKGGYAQLSLAAIAMEDEHIPIGKNRSYFRRAGEALHPEREPLDMLEQYKAEVGEMLYSAQYQQNPVPLEGNLIKMEWFERYEVAPSADEGVIVQSWDTAAKVGAQNAYTVCHTFLRRGSHHYLLHVLRQKLDYPTLRQTVIDHARTMRARDILIEDAALGTALIQDLRADPNAPNPIAVKPDREKIERMAQCTPMIQAHAVFLPKVANWLHAFEVEMKLFPHSAYNDQVDAFSQYLNWVRAQTLNDYGTVCIAVECYVDGQLQY